jgi:hypothetical protein
MTRAQHREKYRRARSRRSREAWADPDRRERWVAAIRAAARDPEVRARKAAALARVKERRRLTWDRLAMKRWGLTAEQLPLFRAMRRHVADSAEAARRVKRGVLPDTSGIPVATRRALARYGLTPDELPLWRQMRAKLRSGPEAAAVVKRSRPALPFEARANG